MYNIYSLSMRTLPSHVSKKPAVADKTVSEVQYSEYTKDLAYHGVPRFFQDGRRRSMCVQTKSPNLKYPSTDFHSSPNIVFARPMLKVPHIVRGLTEKVRSGA
jgi:hypothetical protein